MSAIKLPYNPYWDTVDYTKLTNRSVYRVIRHEYVGEQAIQKILKTVTAPHVLLEAANHPHAHIVDIAEAFQKAIESKKLTAQYEKRMLNVLYIKKRSEWDAYFQKEHNLDTSGMPQDMLKGLLGI
jgi:hypothetical protein